MTLADFLFKAHAANGRNQTGAAAKQGFCIRLDDQTENDVYPCFCQIHVTADDADSSSVLLELVYAPYNAEVGEIVQRHGGELLHGSFGATIGLTVGSRDAQRVRDLAKTIRRITRRGENYPDRNWKWICPRTADSLDRLAKLLAEAKRSRCG